MKIGYVCVCIYVYTYIYKIGNMWLLSVSSDYRIVSVASTYLNKIEILEFMDRGLEGKK